MPLVENNASIGANFDRRHPTPRRFWVLGCAVMAVYVFLMCFRYGQLPIAPVVGDEIIINDASVSLAQGHGYAARSFADSKYGLDHVFAHFPPLYPYAEALAFRVFGVSAYSLRLTTTVMSLATMAVFLFLLGRLCRAGLLDWDNALLLGALFGTNAALLTFDRTARMESMVGLLVIVSLLFIFEAVTIPPGRRHWPFVLAAAGFVALSVAVHPEAVTALLFIGGLILLVVPGSMRLKIAAVGSFVVIPIIVGFGIFGRQLITAIRQFLAIAHDAEFTEPTSSHQVMELLQSRNVTSLSRALFLALTILLLAAVPVAYPRIRAMAPSSFRLRLSTCIAGVGVLELLLMVFVLRMSERRFEYLYAPFLVCDVLCLWGARPFRTWQRTLGWATVGVQCIMAGFYLAAPGHDALDRDPDRYLPLIRQIPPGVAVASTPGLWLDLQQERRPFTLIYYGLDGEESWTANRQNPLDRFDVIFLQDFYAAGRPWWLDEAQAGRTKYRYPVGSDIVEVYVRNGIAWQPK